MIALFYLFLFCFFSCSAANNDEKFEKLCTLLTQNIKAFEKLREELRILQPVAVHVHTNINSRSEVNSQIDNTTRTASGSDSNAASGSDSNAASGSDSNAASGSDSTSGASGGKSTAILNHQANTKTGYSFLTNKTRSILIISTCTCAAVYLYYWYRMKQTNELLRKKDAWCRWKSQTKMQDLITISQKDLAEDLLAEIRKTYQNTKNPSDRIFPYVAFLRDSQHEEYLLKLYIRCSKVITKLHLRWAFPVHHTTTTAAIMALQRLAYLKVLFFSLMPEEIRPLYKKKSVQLRTLAQT